MRLIVAAISLPWIALTACGEPPTRQAAGPAPAALYKAYNSDLDALEARPHAEEESLELRQRWISRFIELADQAPDEQKSHHLGIAALLQSNMSNFMDDEAYARTAWETAVRACQHVAAARQGEAVQFALMIYVGRAADDDALTRVVHTLSEALPSVQAPEVRQEVISAIGSAYFDLGDVDQMQALLQDEGASLTGWHLEHLQRSIARLREPAVGANVQVAVERISPAFQRGSGSQEWTGIVFVSPSCGACKTWLHKYAALPSEGRVRIVIVVCEDASSTSRASMYEKLLPGAAVISVERDTAEAARFMLTSFPRALLLDPSGVLRAKDIWPAALRSLVAGK